MNRIKSGHCSNHNLVSYASTVTNHVSREYYCNRQNNERLYECRTAGPKNAITKREQSIKLFVSEQPNNFLFSCHEDPKSEYNHVRHTAEQAYSSKFSNIGNIGITADIDKLLIDDRRLPYRSLGLHKLEESPFKWIIRQDNSQSQSYYCTLHPGKKSIHLENIEHHIIHSDPLSHKAEIKRILGIKEGYRAQ